MNTEPWSFDAAAAAAAGPAGAAVPLELPPEQQRYGALWPVPEEQVSDHSAEGAPWLPTARGIPQDPPQGPLWAASHAGPPVPYDAQGNQNRPATGNHRGAGKDYDLPGGAPNIGRPFTARIAQIRHLITDMWDPTGKRVPPPDAPSAPHELYGSEHYTRPRMTPAEPGPLLNWAWAQGPQFTQDPGYWGVQGGPPDLAARPQGAVAAQMPSDPYVAQSVPAVSAGVDYDWGV